MYGRISYRSSFYLGAVSLALSLLLSACRTSQGVGVVQAQRIKDKTSSVMRILNDPNLTEKEKIKAVVPILKEVDEQAEELGEDRDAQAVSAEANASSASKWRWFVGILITVAVVCGLYLGRGFILHVFTGGVVK